jgi:hypothetical protein
LREITLSVTVHDGKRSGNATPKYKSTLLAVYKIGRSEGIRGLYQGFAVAIIGSTVAWGLYMFLYVVARFNALTACLSYSKIKRNVQSAYNLETLEFHHYFVSGVASSMTTSILTNPIW